MEKKLPFLGIGWSFPPTFNKSLGTVQMTSGEEDINNSLEILLSTEIGERLIEPNYGCNLKNLVFEPIDASLLAYIEELITNAIVYFEPRIKLERVKITESQEEGKLYFNI